MTETTTAQTMAVLAELVLMATRHNLPMPLYLTASEKNCQLNLTLNNRADLDAWHWAFGGGRLWECEPTASSPSVLVTNMHGGSLMGWSVNLQANVPPPLSPEVLAALGEAARSDAVLLVACDTSDDAVADRADAMREDALDEPKARQWRDRDGDIWTEEPWEGGSVLAYTDLMGDVSRWTFEHVERECGPLVEVQADAAVLVGEAVAVLDEPCCEDHSPNLCGVAEDGHDACCPDCPEFGGAS